MRSFGKKQVIWLTVAEVLVALLCLNYALKNPGIFQERMRAACFIAVSAAVLLLTGVGYALVFVKKMPLHRLVLVLGFAFGLLSSLINTPGSIPDEPAHASNIYLWSNRLLFLPEKLADKQNNPVYMDVESVVRRADLEGIEQYRNSVATVASYRNIFYKTNWFYNGNDRELVSVTLRDNSVTPIVYLPAIIGFTVARLFSLGYYPMLMLGRLCMLAFYVFAASWAIKKIPVGKMALFLTALLPMSLHLAASLSYDAVILALSMMTFSYIVYLAYGEVETIRWKERLTMLVLAVLLASCKVGVYLPILLLLLLVPKAKFGGGKQKTWIFILILLASAVSCVLMNLPSISLGTHSTRFLNDQGETLITSGWALQHPVEVLKMMLATVKREFFLWIRGAIGNSLSWFTIRIRDWVVLGFGLCLLSAILKEEGTEPITPTLKQRLLLLVPVILCGVMFLFGMLVWWTPQGATVIEGVQGRYFIPMIPLVLFAVPQFSLKLHLKSGEKVFPQEGFSRQVTMACILLTCASLIIQAAVILAR